MISQDQWRKIMHYYPRLGWTLATLLAVIAALGLIGIVADVAGWRQ
jgi:hypothetical protein